MDINKTDKRILAILEKNARASAAAIGREIGLSRTAVQDRIGKLEKSKVIQGYHTATNAHQADLIRAVLFIDIAERPCEPALTWLSSLEGVSAVYSLAGNLDAIAICAVPSMDELSRLNDRIGSSPLITSAHSQIILSRHD